MQENCDYVYFFAVFLADFFVDFFEDFLAVFLTVFLRAVVPVTALVPKRSRSISSAFFWVIF